MAAFAKGGESSPLLSGVRFAHNQAVIKSIGGGFAALGMFTSASPVLTDVTFYSNTAAFGGGMLIVIVSNSVSSAVLNNVIFDSNAGAIGGALTNIGYANGASNPTLTDVVFRQNQVFIDSDFRAALDRVPNGTNVTIPNGGAIASAGTYIVPPDAYDGSAGPLGPTDIFFVAFTEIVTPSMHIATPPGGLRFAGKSYTLEAFFN